MLHTIYALLACLAPAGAPPGYMLELSPVKAIEATETCTIRGPKLNATEWIFMAARPPELPGQTKVNAMIVPGITKALNEFSSLSRPIVESRIPVTDKKYSSEITVKVKYQATLISRKLVQVAAGSKIKPAPPLSANERRLYLASASLMDHESSSFKRWLQQNKLRRGEQEDSIEFARRAFTTIRKSYSYKFIADQDRHASHLCTQGSTDCGGHAVLFASALRANGIPCRVLVGRLAESATKEGGAINLQCHVRAEFYIDAIGWVPADLTFGLFGEDPGDLLVLHVDYDLVYDTRAFGRQTLLFVQLLASWSTGSGSYDGSTTTFDWQVRTLPQ